MDNGSLYIFLSLRGIIVIGLLFPSSPSILRFVEQTEPKMPNNLFCFVFRMSEP